MAYKSKFNINIGGTNFEKGKTYSDEEVANCDLENFELVTDQVTDENADLDSEVKEGEEELE